MPIMCIVFLHDLYLLWSQVKFFFHRILEMGLLHVDVKPCACNVYVMYLHIHVHVYVCTHTCFIAIVTLKIKISLPFAFKHILYQRFI